MKNGYPWDLTAVTTMEKRIYIYSNSTFHECSTRAVAYRMGGADGVR
jgi:hypothetical protein